MTSSKNGFFTRFRKTFIDFSIFVVESSLTTQIQAIELFYHYKLIRVISFADKTGKTGITDRQNRKIDKTDKTVRFPPKFQKTFILWKQCSCVSLKSFGQSEGIFLTNSNISLNYRKCRVSQVFARVAPTKHSYFPF